MTLLRHLSQAARIPRIWVPLGIIGPIGMLLVSGLMLIHMRDAAWKTADQTAKNLLQVLEHDIAHEIESYDLSLQGVVENLKIPGLQDLDPKLRQLVLFDRASGAVDRGIMGVLDEQGDMVEDMGVIPPRKSNYADREYFQFHKTHADGGLFISKPLTSRLTGIPIIVLSRRINKPDGSFGGIALGTMKQSHFTRLFAKATLGSEDGINLFRDDGTRIARYPYVDADVGASIAGSSTFQRFMEERRGSFNAVSSRDQVERHYAFAHVGDFPLILDVGLSTRAIEGKWRVEASIIIAASVLLCGSTIGLVLWAAREFRRRIAIEAELARLSATDALTGVPNRRRFDDALASTCERARRAATPVSLLIVDADHFKRVNDRLGHQTGDEVLKALARCLTLVVHRDADLVCRLGGEEFALLLPNTDLRGAQQIADKVHRQIAGCHFWPLGIEDATITVSIGIASSQGSPQTVPTDLYAAADAALYDAKAAGRNRTRCAATPLAAKHNAGGLRVVSG